MENCGLVSAEHNKQVQHDAVVEETDEGAYICREGIPSKKILLTPVLTWLFLLLKSRWRYLCWD